MTALKHIFKNQSVVMTEKKLEKNDKKYIMVESQKMYLTKVLYYKTHSWVCGLVSALTT